MKIVHVYCGADGQTHFEDIEWEETLREDGMITRTAMRKTDETMFATQAPGTFIDWHTAPGHRLVTMVSGTAEVGVSDGEKRIVRQGDVLLFEDTIGPGHTMRVLGNEPRVALHVNLT